MNKHQVTNRLYLYKTVGSHVPIAEIQSQSLVSKNDCELVEFVAAKLNHVNFLHRVKKTWEEFRKQLVAGKLNDSDTLLKIEDSFSLQYHPEDGWDIYLGELPIESFHKQRGWWSHMDYHPNELLEMGIDQHDVKIYLESLLDEGFQWIIEQIDQVPF